MAEITLTEEEFLALMEARKSEYLTMIAELEKELLASIVEIFLFEKKVEVDIEDCGYDISEYPRKTFTKYVLEDYTTVEDFLEEANGHKEATYCSGMGFIAKKHEGDIWDALQEGFCEWFRDVVCRYLGDDLDTYEISDFFVDWCHSDEWALLEKLKSLPLGDIVRQYGARAIQNRHEGQERARQARIKSEADLAWCIAMDNKLMPLFSLPRYKASNIDALDKDVALIKEQLSHSDFNRYLKSDQFSRRVSQSVFRKSFNRYGIKSILPA